MVGRETGHWTPRPRAPAGSLTPAPCRASLAGLQCRPPGPGPKPASQAGTAEAVPRKVTFPGSL